MQQGAAVSEEVIDALGEQLRQSFAAELARSSRFAALYLHDEVEALVVVMIVIMVMVVVVVVMIVSHVGVLSSPHGLLQETTADRQAGRN